MSEEREGWMREGSGGNEGLLVGEGLGRPACLQHRPGTPGCKPSLPAAERSVYFTTRPALQLHCPRRALRAGAGATTGPATSCPPTAWATGATAQGSRAGRRPWSLSRWSPRYRRGTGARGLGLVAHACCEHGCGWVA